MMARTEATYVSSIAEMKAMFWMVNSPAPSRRLRAPSARASLINAPGPAPRSRDLHSLLWWLRS